ncbi:MAG TPA: glycosyl hydrolase family 28-related protein [Cytophagaceae bacterium]|jgi:hypothetical protein
MNKLYFLTKAFSKHLATVVVLSLIFNIDIEAQSFPYPSIGAMKLPCSTETLPDVVINVTLPPYNADPTGKVDATAAFNLALSKTYSWVYVPNGRYKFSDSITWMTEIDQTTGPKKGRGGKNIVMWGESRDGVILQLDNNARGFSDPKKPKPFIFTGEDSPDRFNNSIHNVTILTGSGNPGAIGLRHYCSNYGGLYNVTIKSGDGNGVIGLDKGYSRANGPHFTKGVLIDGFNIGIHTDFAIESETYEHITLQNQKVTAWHNARQVLSIRDLKVINGPATALINESGHVVLLDGNLAGTGAAAIKNFEPAKLLIRNLTTSGYTKALDDPQKPVLTKTITEWLSNDVVSQFPAEKLTTLNLPINETPTVAWPNPTQWVNVQDFGATPNGSCATPTACRPCDDDAPKIQAAIDATLPGKSRAGATTLYMPGNYRLRSSVRIRGSINRIIGAGGGAGGPYNGKVDYTGEQVPTLFIVDPTSAPVIVFENFTQGGAANNKINTIETNGKTVVFRNMGLDSLNITGGEVYLESVALGNASFKNSKVWVRNLDPERKGAKVTVDGGSFWCLGLKTEGDGDIVVARNNAKVEVFGAWVYSQDDSRNRPMFVIDNSDVSINFFEYNSRWGTPYVDLIKETQNGQTKTIVRGAPSTWYPTPAPITAPTYPAYWSNRNDNTGVTPDGVVGSNIVLFRSFNKTVVTDNESPLITKDYKVYPNPASNEVSVSLEGVAVNSDVVIKLIDLTGKTFASDKFTYIGNPYTFSVAERPLGLYFLNVSDGIKEKTTMLMISR